MRAEVKDIRRISLTRVDNEEILLALLVDLAYTCEQETCDRVLSKIAARILRCRAPRGLTSSPMTANSVRSRVLMLAIDEPPQTCICMHSTLL